ncbi:sodium:calcium antiporter [bacterium]|nr:sodium:calcium antiporter [bacterium]
MFSLFEQITNLPAHFLFLGTLGVGIVIVLAGSWLSRLGDKLAEITGLSSSWIGIILLATITSVPELAATFTSVAAGVKDIGVGNVFGSNMFNMFIIAILDFLQGPGPVMLSVSATQILPAAQGIFLMALAAAGIFAVQSSPEADGEYLGWLFSSLLLISWVVGTFITFRSEQATVSDEEYRRKPNRKELRKVIINFGIATTIVIIAGIILIAFAKGIAQAQFHIGKLTFQLGNSFAGTIIVAIVTSLPELVVSISAYRIGAVNMAIANLFGSNTYNMLLIPIMEIITPKQSIFSGLQNVHLITACFAIILTSVAIMGVVYRSRKSILYLGWDAIAILGFFLLGNYIFFTIAISVH